MVARLSSSILLLFISRCWLPILDIDLLGGAVVDAAAPSDFGPKVSHSTRRSSKSNDEVASASIAVSGGKTNVAKSSWSSSPSKQISSATTAADETSTNESLSEPHSMGSPESLKLKPRVISLNIMVAGLAGLGKTTLCRALLDAWWEEIQEDKGTSSGKTKENGIARLGSLASSFSSSLSAGGSTTSSGAVPQTRARRTISTTAISPSAPFEYFDEKANTILRVRIIDTPGFGNRVNHRNSVKPITDFISDCRRKRFRREKSPSFKQSSGDDDDANNRLLVHVCLYFLSPGRFLAIDRHFLKHVQDEVTIVPVIAKADTMTDDEIARYRAELARIWEDESIGVYSLDERSDRKFKFGGNSMNRPNVASSGNEKFYRGRRPGETLAIISRDGMYPWGHSCALDPEHSDLKLIRDSLLSEHTERFLELATAKYVAFRDAQIAKQSRSETLKYVALVALAAIQLGRLEIKGTTLREVVAKGMSVFAPVADRLKLPKFQLSFSGLKSLTGKESDEDTAEAEEVDESPKKRWFLLHLFGKKNKSANEIEPVTEDPEPPQKRWLLNELFGRKSTSSKEIEPEKKIPEPPKKRRFGKKD